MLNISIYIFLFIYYLGFYPFPIKYSKMFWNYPKFNCRISRILSKGRQTELLLFLFGKKDNMHESNDFMYFFES